MPGLIRGVARTAAVVGTATVVSNGVSRRQQGRWAAEQQQTPPQAAPPPPAQAAAAPDSAPPAAAELAPAAIPVDEAPAAEDMSTKLAQLQQLGELKAQGILTDEEFDAQKTRILDS
jgi:hypothetical protein